MVITATEIKEQSVIRRMTGVPEVLDYPKFRWPASGWWWTVIGALVAVALLVFPKLTHLSDMIRVFLGALFVVAPGGITVLWYGTRCLFVFVGRAQKHRVLIHTIGDQKRRLDAAESTLTMLLREKERQAYQISYCYAAGHRAFIALPKKSGPPPAIESDVVVIDQETNSQIGEFRILQNRDRHWICERAGYMDPLWLGNVIKNGTLHSEPPPGALAWVFSGRRGDRDDG